MNGHSSNENLGGGNQVETVASASTADRFQDPNATIDSLRVGQKTLPSDQPMYLCRECGSQLALQVSLAAATPI